MFLPYLRLSLSSAALSFCCDAEGFSENKSCVPEGYIEAFANIYMAFIGQIRAAQAGKAPDARAADCPGIAAAVRGMSFIELVVAASDSDQKWHAFPVH